MTNGATAVLLTGAVGAGKTTLATEIGEQLREANVSHAVIELDWLAWCMTPSRDAQARRRLVLENLACLVRNYEAAGIDRFVLVGSIVSDQHLAAIRATLDRMKLKVVRIAAPAELLVERVERRDVGRLTLGSTEQAAAFIATARAAVPDCVEIDNSSDHINATARLILDQIGWSEMNEPR